MACVALTFAALHGTAAHAMVAPPGPSFGTNLPLDPPVTGNDLFSVAPAPDLCDLLCQPPGAQPESEDAPDCQGCVQWATMYWADYGSHEKVSAEGKLEASESIASWAVHGALIRESHDAVDCYGDDSATYVWQNSVSTTHTSSLTLPRSSDASGTNATWTLAEGSDFYDDGSHWVVDDGSGDIACKKF